VTDGTHLRTKRVLRTFDFRNQTAENNQLSRAWCPLIMRFAVGRNQSGG